MSLKSLAVKLKPFKRPTWFDRLPPAKQRELADLRAAYHGGELSQSGHRPSINQLYQLVVAEFGDVLCRTSFSSWMLKHDIKVKS